MEAQPPQSLRTLDELTLRDRYALEDLVDRTVLGDMIRSFFDLFRLPLRIYSASDNLLADASEQPPLYSYLNEFRGIRDAIQTTVDGVKKINPAQTGEVTFPCVTGAVYRIVGITYDTRMMGRMIIGPFVPAGVSEVSAELRAKEPSLDPEKLRTLFAQMPRVREETVSQIARHLCKTLDLILFSGHRALLSSNMHLASVRESYQELEGKNAKLQDAYDRLKELDRLKSNFLATVSHELRTPLTSIIGYSEMLSEGIAGDLTEEQRDFVRTIYEKGEQLLHLIKGLLDLSKLESGTMSLKKAYSQVGPLVRDIAQTVAPTARKKGVHIETHVEAGIPDMWADTARLRQVFLNLVDNAIKFTPEGGLITISSRLTTLDANPEDVGGLVLMARRQGIEFRIADTGIGIPDAEKPRVFDAFYQVDSSSTREQGGTGLGLSIVKRLVESHNGRVTIEDNQPTGAVFVVVIPCRRATMA
ncbi:MAG: ATP-binding protein [Polyangiaceae bacterium]|nr:ATP-binding protein [Polyangiaceae bacterium]